MARIELDSEAQAWLDRLFEGSCEPTDFHKRVMLILDRAFSGVHNSPLALLWRRDRRRRRDDDVIVYSNAMHIRCIGVKNAATYDGGLMTTLVVLAHYFAIRIELSLEGRTLWLRFHERKRDRLGTNMAPLRKCERHPMLSEAARNITKGLEDLFVIAELWPERASTDAQGSGVDAGRAGGAGVPAGSCAAVEAERAVGSGQLAVGGEEQ